MGLITEPPQKLNFKDKGAVLEIAYFNQFCSRDIPILLKKLVLDNFI